MAEVAEDVLDEVETTGIDDGSPETIIRIPVVKAGKGYMVEVDLEKIPIEMYRDALFRGLKAMVNSRMSKLDSTKDMTGTELEGQRTAIMQAANKNLEDIYTNKIRKSVVVKEKSEVPTAVMAEARRIAKVKIKDQIKREGKKKVSLIKAAVLTKAANDLIGEHPEIIEMARRNLAKRDEGLDDIQVKSTAGIEEDSGLAQKAEARVKTRSKPKKGEEDTPQARGKGKGGAQAHA